MSSTQIKLWKDDGWWVATDIPTGVTSQGESRHEALSNLDEAVELYEGETGHPPSEEELEDIGVEPDSESSDSELFE